LLTRGFYGAHRQTCLHRRFLDEEEFGVERRLPFLVTKIMQTFSTETTIRHEGELHLDHLPFHTGDKVKVIILPPAYEEDSEVRRGEYEAFMKGYAEEDAIYDLP
jgi:hypothetical protein